MHRSALGALLLVAGISAACGGSPPKSGTLPPSDPVSDGVAALRIDEVWELDGYPDWLLEAFGSLWAKTDDGHLLSIDLDDGALLDTYETGYSAVPACQGLGRDATALWTCAGNEALVRIDPDTGDRTKVPVPKRSDEGRIAFAAGLAWVILSGTENLVGLDEAGAVSATVRLGAVCTDLAFDEADVFVLCPTENMVLKVHAASASVTGTLAVDDPRQAAVGDDLFVGTGDGLVQVDTETLEILHTYAVRPGLEGSVAATAQQVWVRSVDDGFLTQIDPQAQRIVGRLAAPQYPSGGDVVITDSGVWATAFDDSVLVRVVPE
ncbi:hypothetical protein [Nocardioides sp.]|uniref:hypothetical protein n=1 Tax=Nocardioides sp. TaxID=35761 RepID=UPI0031FEF67E